MKHKIIPNSHYRLSGQIIGDADQDIIIQVTLILRREAPLDVKKGFQQANGAAKKDIDTIVSVLNKLGITIVKIDATSRRIIISGSVGQLSNIFQVSVKKTKHANNRIQSRAIEGPISVPEDFGDIVTAVLGIDNRVAARNYSLAAAPDQLDTEYTPLELADIYGFPQGDGSGQTVAIIELGGGYSLSDLNFYFNSLGVETPNINAIGIDGGSNQYGQGNLDGSADGEVALDIEVAGAIAPKSDYLVYFAPNTDSGFVNAVATAVHATPTPAVISISWGSSEDENSVSYMNALSDTIADAAALGIVVAVSSGDSGSGDGDPGVHVNFPASAPYALACGGTTLSARDGQVISEVVWDDNPQTSATGGGISNVYPVPEWQKNVNKITRAGTNTTGRGVPDVAADADPNTGYYVYVRGTKLVIGGTSAVAPLWSGLIARLVQITGKRYGQILTLIYDGLQDGESSPYLRDITSGNNGAYEAGTGWDPCTGLGVPTDKVIDILK